MKYYLKISKNADGRTYLSVDSSTYSAEKHGTVHSIYESLGSVETLKKNGMQDPIAFYKEYVKQLNEGLKAAVEPKIEQDPYVYLGYFPLKSLLERLDVKQYIDILASPRRFNFSVSDLLADLIYARAVRPCSKSKTYTDVLPKIYKPFEYSYDQLLEGLEFIGENYSKIAEIFATAVKDIYGLDMTSCYFDCTNFYFEIDREDDFRRKGPCKSKSGNPIVGMGLLLDKRLIPANLIIYPGNYPEKRALGDLIGRCKRENLIVGKTIHVADKGITSAANIKGARDNGNGYIFGHSVKKLSDEDTAWVLDANGYTEIKDRNGNLLYKYKSKTREQEYTIQGGKGIQHETFKVNEKRVVVYSPALARKDMADINRHADRAANMTSYDARRADYGTSGKYLKFEDAEGKTVQPTLNLEAIQKDKDLAGYTMIVTSEVDMSDEAIHDIYNFHNNIEQAFKIMKSDIDTRPIFVQKEGCIKGHLLICYLYVLLERIFQYIELKDQFHYTDVVEFMKGFVLQDLKDGRYSNLLTPSPLVDELVKSLHRPLDNYFLDTIQVESFLNVMTITQIEKLKAEEAKKNKKPRGRPRKDKTDTAPKEKSKKPRKKKTEQAS